MGAVLAVLNDTRAATRWLYQCETAAEIEASGFSSKVIHHTNKPCIGKLCVKKRDYIFRAEIHQ